MSDLLKGLTAEKRDRIINAVFEEFSSRGYEKASTNSICSHAGISKGSLFKYFGTKKEMFLQLFDYCNSLFEEEFIPEIDLQNPDLLVRLRSTVTVFLRIFQNYPLTMEFFRRAKYETHPEVAAEIAQKKSQSFDSSYSLLIEGLDFSLFRENLDPHMIMKTISTALQGLLESHMRGDFVESDRILEELENYITFFRDAFYKS